MDKVNAELVTLTYGTIVAQLCADYENDYAQVNQQLEKMGYNIGVRLIEDFLAKTSTARCGNFRDTADMISKVRSVRCARVGQPFTNFLGWIQNISQYHSYGDELDS